MLKRSDLVKRFEQISLQEIKNHNDSILATNQAIDGLRKALAHLEKNLKENHAIAMSKIEQHERWPEHLQKAFDAKVDPYIQKVSDLMARLDSLQSNTNILFKRFGKEFARKEEIQSLREELERLGDGTADAFVELGSLISEGMEQLASSERVKREQFEKRIKEEPSFIEKMRKECLQKIAENKIDNEGLLKEVQKVKKEAFIQEKKIENLYTLLGRVEEKVRKGG